MFSGRDFNFWALFWLSIDIILLKRKTSIIWFFFSFFFYSSCHFIFAESNWSWPEVRSVDWEAKSDNIPLCWACIEATSQDNGYSAKCQDPLCYRVSLQIKDVMWLRNETDLFEMDQRNLPSMISMNILLCLCAQEVHDMYVRTYYTKTTIQVFLKFWVWHVAFWWLLFESWFFFWQSYIDA